LKIACDNFTSFRAFRPALPARKTNWNIVFKWLTHRSFGANLLAVCVLFIVLGIVFFSSLRYVTRHGETLTVPQVAGQKMAQAEKALKAMHFEVIVQDSAYVDSLPPLTVVRQTPEAGSVVKVERTVYLTLNKIQPPLTAMPDLVNYSFRSAQMTLESQRLQLGDTLYKPDIAKDAVLEQLFQGKPIKAGTMIPEGSRITLVLGDGIGNVANPVPNLVGLTYQQALDLLSGNALNVGVVLTSGILSDTMNAFVTRQNPPKNDNTGQPNYIRAGESVDLWLSQTNPMDTTGGAFIQ
jgi:beta-lactam-binding protein with PASTA domain